MNVQEVLRLIDERVELVEQLGEATERQLDAVRAGRMSELMQILSQKQAPIHRLHDVSRKLRLSLEETNSALAWDSDQQRSECRRKHQASESMLGDLLRLEAECEQLLDEQRQAVGEQLLGVGKARRAVAGYSQTAEHRTTGTSLDLSSGS